MAFYPTEEVCKCNCHWMTQIMALGANNERRGQQSSAPLSVSLALSSSPLESPRQSNQPAHQEARFFPFAPWRLGFSINKCKSGQLLAFSFIQEKLQERICFTYIGIHSKSHHFHREGETQFLFLKSQTDWERQMIIKLSAHWKKNIFDGESTYVKTLILKIPMLRI